MVKKGKTKSKKMPQYKTKLPQKMEIPKSLEWEAPQFHFYSKGWGWTLIILIFAALLGYFFFLVGYYLATVVVVLGVIVFWQQANLKPKKIKVKISSTGVEYNGKFLPLVRFKSFWVVVSEHNKVYFQTTKRFMPPLTILLGKQDPLEIHNFLIQHLPEHHTPYEDMTDKLGRILRF